MVCWEEKKNDIASFNKLLPPNMVDITPTNPFLFPKWCKEMAANPSGVSPLSPHLLLSTDSPLPLRRLTSSATCGRPPYAQSNMLTGRNQRGENHLVKTLQRPATGARSSFLHFLRPGDAKYPKSWKMTSINHTVNHYRSEQNSSWEIPWWKLL